jgi:bifunctional non-homologous end joining protein LigD
VPLEEYRRKRDFRITAEPAGKVGKGRRKSLSFVIQKHAATRLHYDLRLELDGVLKSWAVPKGPSFDPHEKRLAVEVEDHPLDYATFEGTIAEGEYGAGDVIVWDRGTWQPLSDPHQGLKSGKLDFELAGEKMAGRWTLIRTRGKTSSNKSNWLLLKRTDEHAQPQSKFDVTVERPESVKTGRMLDENGKIVPRPRTKSATAKAKTRRVSAKKTPRPRAPAHARRGKAPRKRSSAQKPDQTESTFAKKNRKPLPDFVAPQLATLEREPPSGPGWLHEIKFDGYRMLCRIENGKVKLITRREQDWTHRYPGIAREALRLPHDSMLLDGEVCALSESGVSSFQALQNAGNANATTQLVYFVFDLLYLDGHDLRSLPLAGRKELLKGILSQAALPAIQYSEEFDEDGPALLRESCRLGLEGIISKRRDRPYISGRTPDWIKTKCLGREELVIGGFTLSEAVKRGIGALLVGYFDQGKLHYAGRVGTGFSTAMLVDLRSVLERLVRDSSPFIAVPAKERGRLVRWVEPKLVAEVEFTSWTEAGVLRHPSFQGLREDKSPQDINRPPSLKLQEENAMARQGTATKKGSAATKSRPKKSNRSTERSASARPKKRGAGGAPKLLPKSPVDYKLTNPDRVLWPDIGLTKLDLATYYTRIADWILPHLVDRPLSMVRCPEGSKPGKCFYQKHAGPGTPTELARVPVREHDGIDEYLAVRDLAGLLSLAQMSILEIHPWGSRRDKLDNPDRIIIDLDPDEGLPWQNVIDAAFQTRELLEEMGLVTFLKTTGGKGLHVVAPISPRRHDWDEVKSFARHVAETLVSREPTLYVANMSKAQRRGKIFVDYLRNDHGSTAIAPYSTRSKAGAPVAAPLAWDELTPRIRSNSFTVQNLPARLESLRRDPWAEIGKVRQSLPRRK